MSTFTTYDFQIFDTELLGVSLVCAQNEDAFRYLVDETEYSVFDDGTTPIFEERIGDFISDAEHAHLCCELV
jgi:hypothetical protein